VKLKLFSSTGIERVANCPGSAGLDTVRVGESSNYAARGTAIHAFLQYVGTIGKEEALEACPEEWREDCAAIDLSGVPQIDPSHFAQEVSILYDPFTDRAREIGRGIGRAAYASVKDRKPTEIAMTIDTVAITDSAVIVDDYKTGWAQQKSPKKIWQLKVNGVGAAVAFRRTEAHVSITRIPSGGDPWSDRGVFTAFDLDEIKVELQGVILKARTQEQLAHDPLALDLAMGPWCDYCRSLVYCPAQKSLISSLASNPEAFVTSTVEMLTPERAGEALARLVVAEKALGRAREAVKGFARNTPIPTADGRLYGAVPGTDTEFDAVKGELVIKALWGPAAASEFASKQESRATKASLERAAKAFKKATGKKASIKDLTAEGLYKLTHEGCVTTSRTESVKEYTPKGAR
jgi:hypothetical protein